MIVNLDKSDWSAVTLGDVAEPSKEKCDPTDGSVRRYVAGEHMDTDSLKIDRWGEVGDGYLGPAFHRRFHPGQVLYGSRRTYLRKVAVADFEGVCANTTFVVSSKDPALMLDEFLPLVMTSEPFHAHSISQSKGSVNPYVNWPDIAAYDFDLPPLQVQRRLADLLWTLEKTRNAVRDCFHTAQEAYEFARLALLTVGLHRNWTEVGVNASSLDKWTQALPPGWQAETLGGVSSVRSGATPSRSKQVRYFDGGEIPWVKTLDLNEGLISSTEEQITDAAVAETSAKVFPPGTVLVAMYGGFAQIGRTARLSVAAATNQAVSAILDLRDDVDPEYLHEVLKAGRPKWRKVAASSRKDPNITKTDVEEFGFPLPPLGEQREILKQLSQVQKAVDAYADELSSLHVLKTALMREIFGSGK